MSTDLFEEECACGQVFAGRAEDEAEQKLMAHEVAEHEDNDSDPGEDLMPERSGPEEEIECTCGLTFYRLAEFYEHQRTVIDDEGTMNGHWEVGTI